MIAGGSPFWNCFKLDYLTYFSPEKMNFFWDQLNHLKRDGMSLITQGRIYPLKSLQAGGYEDICLVLAISCPHRLVLSRFDPECDDIHYPFKLMGMADVDDWLIST